MNKTNIIERLRRTFSALAAAGALFALPGANADTQTAHGSWTDCEHVTNIDDRGSYLVIEVDVEITFTGTFDGTWVGTEEDVFYPDGYATTHGEGTFTGSVAGRGGTESDTVRVSYYDAFSLGGFPHRRGAVWMVDE